MKPYKGKKIKKAIFPVAGLGTRFLPATKSMPKEMMPILDKPLIQYAVEEALDAGIEEIIFITGRGKSSIEDHFDHSFEMEQILTKRKKTTSLKKVKSMILNPGSFVYVRQQEPAGLGHAVWCARHLVGSEPVAILLADDLILGKVGCLKQMINKWKGGNMVAVTKVPKNLTSSYGIITPGEIDENLIEVLKIEEKPLPNKAESDLAVVGRYIIENEVFDHLSLQKKGALDEIQLTDSLSSQINKMPFYGLQFSGERFDCGTKSGFIKANISVALKDPEIGFDVSNWIKSIL